MKQTNLTQQFTYSSCQPYRAQLEACRGARALAGSDGWPEGGRESNSSAVGLRGLLRAKARAPLAVLAAALLLAPTVRAELPRHNIAAARLDVVQNDTGNTAASVTVTTNYAIGDFRVRDGSNRGDFNVQWGDDFADDYTNAVLMSSVTQNGRDNGESGPTLGTIYSASFVQPAASGYIIDVNIAGTNGAGGNPEYNVNVAGAFFSYTNWLGGYAFPLSGANGSATVTNDTLIGSPQLVYGTHYIDKGSGGGANAGKSIVDLTSLGIDSRKDGVLIVNGAKNESANYALSQVNSNNGTWNLFIRDTGNTGANGEQDPIAFVFIPKTNNAVISGRFRGDASIALFSGASAQFTVSKLATGRYELKIPSRSGAVTNGVLIVSSEGGGAVNFDNILSYQINGAGDGWEIQSRDCPAVFTAPSTIAPPLESPGAGEDTCSFVYIPGPTPGFSVSPTNGLSTTEDGGTATFTVALHTQPSADVTIALSSSNTGEGTVSPTSLTFNSGNWNTPQVVTVTGVDDAVVDGAVAYTIVLASATSADPGYNGLNPDDVSVVNIDNESGITVAPTSGLVTTEAGGTATFNVHLNTQPTANVTIGLSSSNTGEGTVSPSSLTFDSSNWNIDQPVTVTGVDDLVADGPVGYTIITAPSVSTDPIYNGINPPNVSVVNMDNDTAGIVFGFNQLDGLTVVEGGTTNFTVALNSQPMANVTVTFISGNTSQGGTISPSSRTFTPGNWNTPQSATITGANDLLLDGNTSWFVTNSCSTSADPVYAALAPALFPVVTLDNEGTLTLPSGDLIYGIGQAGVGLDGRAAIVDTNTPSYNGATLTVTLTANGTADDRLEVRNTGTGPGQIGVSGSAISYEGTAIGSFTGGVGTTPLVATLNSASTPVAGQALLRNITFRNVSGSPSLNRRSVSVALVRADTFTMSANTGVRVGLLRVSDFQEGADHGYGVYAGEADAQVSEASPFTALPAGSGGVLSIDWPNPNDGSRQNQVLMRFDNILGNAFGQVPTNAVLVSVDLILDVPPAVNNSQGDGSGLYRMLMPFDDNNSTWSSWINGVDQDDAESRSTYDSQIGVASFTGDSGQGVIHVGVMADIQAWANGDANYGWVMPAWVGGTDAIFIRPGETANIDERPRLRVLWMPANSNSVASFRQNVNGYTNAADTRIRQADPDTSATTAASVFVDWSVFGSTNNDDQVLIRFDNIFGLGAGQIPQRSRIDSAMLDLATVIGNGYGDGGQFFAMLKPWQDTDTWNTLVNGVSADGVEAAATATTSAGSPTLNPNVCGGYMSFDVTADVQAWSSLTRPNYGWAIIPWDNGGDGWGVSLSESATEKDRPRLRVFYTSSVVITSIDKQPSSVTINFTGQAGKVCTILRSTSVASGYVSIGTAPIQSNGTGTFTDNSPPAGQAFYRVQSP